MIDARTGGEVRLADQQRSEGLKRASGGELEWRIEASGRRSFQCGRQPMHEYDTFHPLLIPRSGNLEIRTTWRRLECAGMCRCTVRMAMSELIRSRAFFKLSSTARSRVPQRSSASAVTQRCTPSETHHASSSIGSVSCVTPAMAPFPGRMFEA